MSVITKVRIQNFQSLRDVTISFNKYTNVLVGESDVGKSAVIRALRMVLENEVPSDDFVFLGEKDASVEVWFDSGDKITRVKGKSNIYELHRKGEQKPKRFESFGKEIPRQVQEVIGFAPLDIGGAKGYSINFHKQTDPPFLLGELGSIKAKFIGQLSDLLLMDQVIADVNSEIRTANSNIKFSTNEKSRLKRSLDKFKILPKLEDLLEQLKIQASDINDLNERELHLEKLNEKRSNLIKRRDHLIKEIDRLSICDQIDIQLLEEKQDYIVSLQNLYKRIKQTVNRRDTIEEQVKTQFALIKRLANTEQSVLEKQEMLNELLPISDLLEDNNEKKETSEKIIKGSNQVIVECSREMDVLLSDLPERCPTCGTAIETQQKKFIVQGASQ